MNFFNIFECKILFRWYGLKKYKCMKEIKYLKAIGERSNAVRLYKNIMNCDLTTALSKVNSINLNTNCKKDICPLIMEVKCIEAGENVSKLRKRFKTSDLHDCLYDMYSYEDKYEYIYEDEYKR